MNENQYTDLAIATQSRERLVNGLFRMANTAKRMGNELEASRLWSNATRVEDGLMHDIRTLTEWEKQNSRIVGNWHEIKGGDE